MVTWDDSSPGPGSSPQLCHWRLCLLLHVAALLIKEGMVLVIFLSILLRGNASFAINCSHFHAWQANSCGSGVILMPAELLVQWQCVLCQETIVQQSASPHETQCSAAVVWPRSTVGGQAPSSMSGENIYSGGFWDSKACAVCAR